MLKPVELKKYLSVLKGLEGEWKGPASAADLVSLITLLLHEPRDSQVSRFRYLYSIKQNQHRVSH